MLANPTPTAQYRKRVYSVTPGYDCSNFDHNPSDGVWQAKLFRFPIN